MMAQMRKGIKNQPSGKDAHLLPTALADPRGPSKDVLAKPSTVVQAEKFSGTNDDSASDVESDLSAVNSDVSLASAT